MSDRSNLNDRSHYENLDANDPLGQLRDKFVTVSDEIYLDGNSLGLCPKSVSSRLDRFVNKEWAERGIRGWMEFDWINLPSILGKKLAPIIGASEDEVVFADSTSVNLFKVATAAAQLNADSNRRVILTETGNFPTDEYVLQGIAGFHPNLEFRSVAREDVFDQISEDVAVLVLTHTHYKSGELFDMQEYTRRAHEKGVVVVWDLSHSAGAVPLKLSEWQADFAIGCGYKYLNGGPGAPAFIYVRRDLHERVQPVLAGWMGHKAPFAFTSDFEAANGVGQFQTGTPAALSMATLECGLDIFEGLEMETLAEKSRALGDLFIARLADVADELEITVASPLDSKVRGCQASFAHDNAFAIVRALIDQGVIGDFRAPDIMRFGFPALYTRYVDIFDATQKIIDVIRERQWDKDEYKSEVLVT